MASDRQARLVESFGLGPSELDRLQRSRVALFGAGLLGGALATHLALLGVELRIVDCDRVAPENLGNQSLPAASVGQWKAEARARALAALNPDCSVKAFPDRLEGLGLGRFEDVDLLVAGLDGRASRLHVNWVSQRLAKPWVDAALDGSGQRLLGSVTLFDPRDPNSPCFACRYDSAELSRVASEGRGPGCPSWRKPAFAITPPTLAASPLGAIVAGFQALWAVDLLLGRGGPRSFNHLLINCGDAPAVRSLRLRRNPRCLFDHGSLGAVRPACVETIGELLALAREDLRSAPQQLLFHQRTLVCDLRCPRCGRKRPLLRQAAGLPDESVRCGCAPNVEMAPEALTDRLGQFELQRLADHSWAAMGLPEGALVTATAHDRKTHFFVYSDPASAVTRPGGPSA